MKKQVFAILLLAILVIGGFIFNQITANAKKAVVEAQSQASVAVKKATESSQVIQAFALRYGNSAIPIRIDKAEVYVVTRETADNQTSVSLWVSGDIWAELGRVK